MGFFINTSKVGEVSDSIDTISSKCDTILSSVSGYDTTCEGGFDFAGAKSAIENNLKGADTKFKNTVALLTAVINAHGGIQNSVGAASDSSSSSYSSSSGSYSSGYSSGGYNYSGNYGGYNSSSATTSATPAVVSSSDASSNLSAIDTLTLSTIDTGAEHAIGIPTIIKVDDVLKKIDVKEISVSDIEKETKGRNTIIVEGISSSSDCAEYLVTVSEVTKDYDVSVKYIRLDKVIEDPTIATTEVKETAEDLVSMTKEKVIDIYNSVKKHRRDYTVKYSDDWCAAFVSSVLIKAGYEKYTNVLDPGVGKMKDGFTENKMYQEAKSDTVPEPGSVIFLKDLSDGVLSHVGIVEKVDEDGTIHTIEGNYDGSKVVRVSERKVGDSSVAGYGVLRKEINSSTEEKIIDQEAYDKLTSINSTSEIKLKDTPITLIIKDDKVANSLQGVASDKILEAAIKAAGIPKKTKTVSI